MLKALWRWLWPKEATPTRSRRDEQYITREEQYITREEAKALFDEYSKQLVFEWNEWYEKFDKLHLRLAKRAQRAQREPEPVEPSDIDAVGDGRPSVIHLRRVGSV